MIYVEVNFQVAPQDRATAVKCLTDEMPAMQASTGNRGSRVLIDPASNGAITLLHQWDDLASLDAYRGGSLFAQVGIVLRPMMVGPPRTVVYDASPIG